MMNLISFLLVLISVSISAGTVSGKYKLEMYDENSGMEEVIFLMNSNAEIKYLENRDYFSIVSEPFFTINTLRIKSGGDEDYMIATISVEGVNGGEVIVTKCGAMIDGPGASGMFLGESGITLKKWNTERKKYEVLWDKSTATDIEKCEKELVKDYTDYDIW
jgi:hypothetical protein